MQIIPDGNQPGPIPHRLQMKQAIFSVYINTENGSEIDTCTIQFYHSQTSSPPIARKYLRDKSQPIKNLLFDVDETEFQLSADMCRAISPCTKRRR
jgi:hypothetical protein